MGCVAVANGKISETPPELSQNARTAIFFEELRKRTNIAAVADLNQTITNPPTQAEVQAISDKIDEILAALRLPELMDT